MKNQEKTFEKFTWTINNFSKLDSKKVYSENFFLNGHSWRILIFPQGNGVDYLSIYLEAGGIATLTDGWSKSSDFKLSLINQVNSKMTETKETEHKFNARKSDWGFPSFIPLKELSDSNRGFIVNDACIIEVDISVSMLIHESQVDQAVSNVNVSPVCAEPIYNPAPKEITIASFDELMDFRGLGKIEKEFVPLLEEVCSLHPSLIDCQQNRSSRFKEWAFTALGRVLHFLKTK